MTMTVYKGLIGRTMYEFIIYWNYKIYFLVSMEMTKDEKHIPVSKDKELNKAWGDRGAGKWVLSDNSQVNDFYLFQGE